MGVLEHAGKGRETGRTVRWEAGGNMTTKGSGGGRAGGAMEHAIKLPAEGSDWGRPRGSGRGEGGGGRGGGSEM